MRDDDFPETVWSRISRARAGGRGDLDSLLRDYRRPVLRYVESRAPEEAEDLTQEVFLRIVERRLVERADREKGRFRALVLAVTKNVLREARRRRAAEKRGRGCAPRSLDEPVGGSSSLRLADVVAGPEEDPDFDRFWLEALVARGFDALRRESARKGSRQADALEAVVRGKTPQEELAKRWGTSVSAVKSLVHGARERLAELVREAVRAYCSSPEEYEAEVRCLKRFLP